MALERRLARLEAKQGDQPDLEADAAFAQLAAWLDRLAALKAAGDVEAQRELEAIRGQ